MPRWFNFSCETEQKTRRDHKRGVSLEENDQKQLNSICKFAGTLPNKSVTTKQWSEMIVETIQEQLVRDLRTSVNYITQVNSHAKHVLYWCVIETLCRRYRTVYKPLFELKIAKHFYRTFTVLGKIPQYRDKLKLIRDLWSEVDRLFLHRTRTDLDKTIALIDPKWPIERRKRRKRKER